ncbi:hypothetical protein D3C73_983180 [compost metagenome]
MIFALKIQIGEQFLNHLLAVVEVAFNGQIQHIAVVHCRHLQLLHLADLAVRMQNADLDAFLAANPLDGSRPRIPRGSAEDMNHLAALAGNIGIQLTHELERNILKSKSRPMEQLQHIQGIIHLMQRRYFRRAEIGIAGVDHFF